MFLFLFYIGIWSTKWEITLRAAFKWLNDQTRVKKKKFFQTTIIIITDFDFMLGRVCMRL